MQKKTQTQAFFTCNAKKNGYPGNMKKQKTGPETRGRKAKSPEARLVNACVRLRRDQIDRLASDEQNASVIVRDALDKYLKLSPPVER